MELENITKASDDETHVLEYVKTFKTLSRTLKNNLDKMLDSKKEENQEKPKQELSSVLEESLTGLMNLRINHRNLYLEIEKSRLQTQREKEKIDAVASELEELTYLRDIIISEINGSRNRTFPNISKLEALQNKVRENDVNLKPGNIKENHAELLGEFNQELENRKKVKLDYESKEEEKSALTKKCEEEKNFIAKIPQHIQKVAEACKPLQHLYKTGVSVNYDQIQISKTLPTPFYWLYKKLMNLKESKLDEAVEIELKENVEAAEKFGFFKVQIVFSVLKDRVDPSLKKFNEILNEKALFSGVFPLKFYFSYLLSHELVLVNLESKNLFTVEEILSMIVEDTPGRRLFSEPKNDMEKSLNGKFSFFPWIQELCKEGKTINFKALDPYEPKSQYKIASLEEVVKAVRKRVVNRLLLKHQVESFRNNKQIPVNLLKLFGLNELPKLELDVMTCKKITKEEYLQWIGLPEFLKQDSDSSNELLKPKNLGEKLTDLLTRKAARSGVQVYGYKGKNLAQEKLTTLVQEEGNREDFYRIDFLHPKYKVAAYVIVEYDYPLNEPRLKFKITKEVQNEAVIPDEIRKKFSNKAVEQLKTEKGKEIRVPYLAYDAIERALNEKTNLPDPAFVFTFKVLMLMITIQKHL